MTLTNRLPLLRLLPGLILTACGTEASPNAAPAGTDTPSVYEQAVANPARSADDRARDAGRKPAAVLQFFGIEPRMAVLDLYSGGGYYSELLSYIVGGGGSVTAHSNKAYLDYVSDEVAARYADGRLGNVTVLMAENNELALEPDSLDAVLLMLTFHDFYFVDAERGWPRIDTPALLRVLYSGLRPGGIVGIVDHYAEAGAPRETGNSLHRIDPAIVIADMQAAGFELEATSDLLRNAQDDHSRNVFDPEVRGRTDRFVLRFRKPR